MNDHILLFSISSTHPLSLFWEMKKLGIKNMRNRKDEWLARGFGLFP
jgi:hypothetical protein